MKPDTINAIGMILMGISTIGAIILFRTKPIKTISWKRKVPAAFGGGILTLIVWLLAMPWKRCLEIPEPFGQFKLTALCIMCLIIFIDKEKILLISCIVIIFTGVQLQIQFNELVSYSSDYVTTDANTHELMAKGCSDGNTTENIIAEALWHTWFTGIYKIKQ